MAFHLIIIQSKPALSPIGTKTSTPPPHSTPPCPSDILRCHAKQKTATASRISCPDTPKHNTPSSRSHPKTFSTRSQVGYPRPQSKLQWQRLHHCLRLPLLKPRESPLYLRELPQWQRLHPLHPPLSSAVSRPPKKQQRNKYCCAHLLPQVVF